MKRNKLIWWYITQKNYFGKGYEEFSFVKGLIEFLAIIAIYLKLFYQGNGYKIFLVIGAVGVIAGLWLFGYVWDKYKLYDLQADWGNERNPAIKKILRKL